MLEVVNRVAMFVIALSASYFFLTAGLGVREFRRRGVPLGRQATVRFEKPYDADPGAPSSAYGYYVYFLIPCLDEAAVIGGTVAALRHRSSRVIVIDDASTDGTGEVARQAGGDQVLVVRRELPDAQQGKGAALNQGFLSALADTVRWGIDPRRVVICVMDADGRLSDGALHEVLPLFDDPNVGGAQIAVRIRNRDDNFLLAFQDHQFWTLSALTQVGRNATGTVSLGGNGQFTRLSALLDLGGAPWSASLTEDLDLAVSLSLAGWELACSPRAAVEQEGVSDLRRLLRQRTRWYQGHMMTGRRVPEILRSPDLTNAAALELTLYLAVPWVFDLPWSILFHLVMAQVIVGAISGDVHLPTGSVSPAVGVAVFYVLAFWPALVTGLLAKTRDRSISAFTALKLGHAFVVTNYISFFCCWSALWRIVRGRNGWTKTAREAETAPDAGAAPAEVATGRPAAPGLAAAGEQEQHPPPAPRPGAGREPQPAHTS